MPCSALADSQNQRASSPSRIPVHQNGFAAPNCYLPGLAMNSATIVFSIALLKDAIFAYRAAAADEQRAAKLLAIGRGTRKGSWSPMPSNWGGYYYSTASSWFESERPAAWVEMGGPLLIIAASRNAMVCLQGNRPAGADGATWSQKGDVP